MRQKNKDIFDRTYTATCDSCLVVLPLVDDHPPQGSHEFSRDGGVHWMLCCPGCKEDYQDECNAHPGKEHCTIEEWVIRQASKTDLVWANEILDIEADSQDDIERARVRKSYRIPCDICDDGIDVICGEHDGFEFVDAMHYIACSMCVTTYRIDEHARTGEEVPDAKVRQWVERESNTSRIKRTYS